MGKAEAERLSLRPAWATVESPHLKTKENTKEIYTQINYPVEVLGWKDLEYYLSLWNFNYYYLQWNHHKIKRGYFWFCKENHHRNEQVRNHSSAVLRWTSWQEPNSLVTQGI